jgi:ATP-dependent helicase/nuclease subunit B
MSYSRIFAGPTLSSLESKAFETLADTVGTQSESILYIGKQEHPRDETRERWQTCGSSACLRIDTFDGVVSDCYERDQYKGRVTHVDRPLLFRLVELGVENIESPANPFYTNEEFPRAGLVDAAEDIYTNLEFAGLLSPEGMQSRLSEEGFGRRADHIEELAAAIETARQEILSEELPETYRTERMHHVATMDKELDEIFPAVDAVLVGGFARFDPLERDLLERLAATWPTIGLLPKQVGRDDAVGIDLGAARALETYRDLGFSVKHCGGTPDSSPILDERRRVTRGLYRHPEHAPSTDDLDPNVLNLVYAEAETVPEEIRSVAREIRSHIASGAEAGQIGVVLTSPSEYADQVGEIFDLYDLPYALQTEIALSETALGEVVETICDLSREPRSVETLLTLLTNPLVSLSNGTEPLDDTELARVASRVETVRLETVLDHVDDTAAATIESILQDTTTLRDVSLESLPGQLDALLQRLGVLTALENDDGFSRAFIARESSARSRLDRVLETLSLTASVADQDIGDTVDRLRRALSTVSMRQTGSGDEQRVVVCGLGDAFLREFEQIYVLGMTSSHFPSEPERLSFAQPIYDSHPDFEQGDAGAEARYQFGALLASEASIRLSAPQRSSTGDPYVEADVLTELRRLVDLSEVTEKSEAPPGSQEDVQRAIGKRWTDLTDSRANALIDDAVAAGTFREEQHDRIKTGSECAAARADPMLTPYDAKLSAETVASVHEVTEREPYSPSRLETYAACGFKYYMRRVLGIKSPDPLTREPDAGTRGSYIHAVLEHYYLSLQAADGEPVNLGGDFADRQAHLLAVSKDQLDTEFDEYPATAFQDQWFTSVLAGLGTPNDNPYYGPDVDTDDGRPAARGLFYRFLEHEFEEPAKTTARPTWFEARIGQPYDAGTPIGDGPAVIDTPQGSVPIHGLIDRVDTVPGTDPAQVVVRDYKTGSSIPGENDALLGLNFQLPLYALMAEDALPDTETVGAAYYQVSPPSSVNSRSGQITSQEMAAYYQSDEVDVPLLRFSHPHFETHTAFRRFVEETTAERLGELVGGITEGRFQPTVLDPYDAGCRYCDYAHVCDVRPEHRQETIEDIDDADLEVYVPPIARGHEADDVVEVE